MEKCVYCGKELVVGVGSMMLYIDGKTHGPFCVEHGKEKYNELKKPIPLPVPNYKCDMVRVVASGKLVRVEVLKITENGLEATGVSMNDDLEYNPDDLAVVQVMVCAKDAVEALGRALLGEGVQA